MSIDSLMNWGSGQCCGPAQKVCAKNSVRLSIVTQQHDTTVYTFPPVLNQDGSPKNLTDYAITLTIKRYLGGIVKKQADLTATISGASNNLITASVDMDFGYGEYVFSVKGLDLSDATTTFFDGPWYVNKGI